MSETIELEYASAKQAGQMFGLKRQYLYKLAKEGLVKTASLRRPGKKFGVRLFYLPSLREFLEERTK